MASELPNPALLPFVVAVTGHRDLRSQDLDALRDEVRAVFTAMRKRMPNTPLVLLNALAEGADQLVAEVALQQDLVLVTVLPMPLDVYKTTMAEAAAHKLDELLTLAAAQIELPLHGRTPAQLRASSDARTLCYEDLALFLARQGQALIALWDGTQSTKLGGASRVVEYVRSGTPKESVDEIESRCGMVYHIVTPRLGGAEPAPQIQTIPLGYEPRHRKPDHTIDPAELEELGKMTYAQVEVNFERFNQEAVRRLHAEPKSKSSLLGALTLHLSPFEQRLERLFEQADGISLIANSRRQYFLFWMLVTAMAGAILYGVHGEMHADDPLWWFTFPACVFAAVIIHWRARKTHVDERYQDTRALAEALRVQFFWQLAGLKEPVDRYYLIHRRTELDWIRFALRNVWLLHQGKHEDTTAPPNLHVVLKQWVEDQCTWYGRKANQQSRYVRQREWIARVGLGAAVAWSVLVPLHSFYDRWRHHPRDTKWDAIFHIGLAVPALIVAAFRLWIEQAGYAEQSREYRLMQREFAIKARELAEHMHSPAIAEKLLLDLGIEALKENGGWLLLHRERPLEVLSSP